MSKLKRPFSQLKAILYPLLLLPVLAYGEEEERWYQVEVIIFSQNSPDYHQSEIWPLDFKQPDLKSSRELLTYKKPARGTTTPQLPKAFSLAAKESLQLSDTASRIKRAKDVELMLHLAWVQPGLDEKQAVPVHIYEGMMAQISANTTKKRFSTQGEELPKLDGTLRLSLSRYLHLESDLIWREPLPPGMPVAQSHTIETTPQFASATVEEPLATPAEMSGSNYQVFRMQQSSRMRSSEIHYQDHPVFGIIAVVNRYEPAQ